MEGKATYFFHELYLLDHHPDTVFFCAAKVKKNVQVLIYIQNTEVQKNAHNSSFIFVIHLHTYSGLLTVPHNVITYTNTERRSQGTAIDEAAPGSKVQNEAKKIDILNEKEMIFWVSIQIAQPNKRKFNTYIRVFFF